MDYVVHIAPTVAVAGGATCVLGLVLVETRDTIISNPVIIGLIGVILGSLLTGLFIFWAKRRRSTDGGGPKQENQGKDDFNSDLRPDERRERWFDAIMDFWKLAYDFYKHLMTIALLSIGTVGALIGGPFKGAVQLDKPQTPWWLKALVGVIIGLFTIAAAMAVKGMHSTRTKTLHMKLVKDEGDFKNERDKRVGRLLPLTTREIWSVIQWSYLLGLVAFVIFLFIALF